MRNNYLRKIYTPVVKLKNIYIRTRLLFQHRLMRDKWRHTFSIKLKFNILREIDAVKDFFCIFLLNWSLQNFVNIYKRCISSFFNLYFYLISGTEGYRNPQSYLDMNIFIDFYKFWDFKNNLIKLIQFQNPKHCNSNILTRCITLPPSALPSPLIYPILWLFPRNLR